MFMRIFKLVLISFFLITSAYSNSIYNLIKIPNLEIYELKTPNKLKYFYATKPFRLGVQENIVCNNSDKKTYDEKYQIISSNLKRYSKDFLRKINEKYFERVIHHELFHIINDGFTDIFNEDEWKKFNEPNFKYADCSTCSKKLGLDTYKNTNGFFTEYSMTIPSEDMAEVYSHLITGNYEIFDDEILNKKIKFIKDKLKEIDSTFIF